MPVLVTLPVAVTLVTAPPVYPARPPALPADVTVTATVMGLADEGPVMAAVDTAPNKPPTQVPPETVPPVKLPPVIAAAER